MSLKLKAFGLSLVAMMAMGAFAVMNASAEIDPNGHFTSESASTTIKGTESGTTHRTELTVPGLTGIVCDEASYTGTAAATTVTSLTVTPTYGKCKTTGGTAGETTVDMNGCAYVFRVAKNSTKDNTVDVECSGATKYIAVTHQGCEIRVPAQTVNGVAYKTDVQSEKHAVTLEATATGFTTHFEAGFCILLGTQKSSNLTGSVTVTGTNTATGLPTGITATGSEG